MLGRTLTTCAGHMYDKSPGLVVLVCVMLLTDTLPKVLPNTVLMPLEEDSRVAKALCPATAADESAAVKEMELVTLMDPATTLVMVTFVRALISLKMFASRVLMNCNTQAVSCIKKTGRIWQLCLLNTTILTIQVKPPNIHSTGLASQTIKVDKSYKTEMHSDHIASTDIAVTMYVLQLHLFSIIDVYTHSIIDDRQ